MSTSSIQLSCSGRRLMYTPITTHGQCCQCLAISSTDFTIDHDTSINWCRPLFVSRLYDCLSSQSEHGQSVQWILQIYTGPGFYNLILWSISLWLLLQQVLKTSQSLVLAVFDKACSFVWIEICQHRYIEVMFQVMRLLGVLIHQCGANKERRFKKTQIWNFSCKTGLANMSESKGDGNWNDNTRSCVSSKATTACHNMTFINVVSCSL